MSISIEPLHTRVQVTSTSATLTELLAAVSAAIVVRTSTKKITLIPHATGIYMESKGVTASANSCPMGTSIFTLDGGASLSTLAFYAASGTYMSVWQEG